MSKISVSKPVLALLAAGSLLASAMPASAWVAAHSAGVWRGPAGGVHAYSDSFAAGGPRYGYAPRYGYGGWGAPAGAVAGAAVAGAVVGAAVGATVASLPRSCVTIAGPTVIYSCGGVYYSPYYGPSGVVYQVVPAP
ncbi:hypothetical protein OSH08_09470 [Kaistia geumhonensis]|uniref:Uncharacterized protein n=1 Tax=Kaistia geumhonensis TaxID=410839 RepID=A0ABU0M3J8_9HYPH|nr:hypothetical protein [Kaistia geumhonensis]MCX5479233.1 hypothetical protein [Kaistia geumhonensis]MDQ0515546.1 hypothetical protein [Kaistia geumhonensis]